MNKTEQGNQGYSYKTKEMCFLFAWQQTTITFVFNFLAFPLTLFIDPRYTYIMSHPLDHLMHIVYMLLSHHDLTLMRTTCGRCRQWSFNWCLTPPPGQSATLFTRCHGYGHSAGNDVWLQSYLLPPIRWVLKTSL